MFLNILAGLYLSLSGVALPQGMCLTREEAITVIAHKADVEYGGRVDKWRVWAIADRESGLLHCWSNGRVKVSPTNDVGLLQFHARRWPEDNGVWHNCQVNRYCHDESKMEDPFIQIDVMMTYYDRYRNFDPWNV